MRTRLFVMVAALLLVSAGAKAQQDSAKLQDAAQTPAAQTPAAPAAADADVNLANQIDLGFRSTFYANNSDEARYQRYRDLRDGPVIDRFRFTKSSDTWMFNAQADHAGYLDQRYSASFNDYGRVKVTFEWNQIPLFYSSDTRTLYTSSTPGVLRLDENIANNIQAGTLNLAKAAPLASAFDLKSRRDVADLRAIINAGKGMDVNLYAKTTLRTGHQDWASGWGFADAVEMPAPVDTRTTDLGAALEWTNDRGLFKVGYDGSFFRNRISTLIWDNPLRNTDSPTAGPYQGREALWPDNDFNAVSATGSVSMAGRSHASGYVSVGNVSQNAALIPFTINTALTSPTLPRQTADAQARVTATNFNFTSRPTDMVWFSARFRSYDYDNRTPEFTVGNSVNYDQSLTALNASSENIGYTRKTFDVETSVTPMTYTALRVGYTRENLKQTFRTYAGSDTDTVKVSFDTSGSPWVMLRAVYEHSKRTGTGLDPETLIEIGEQPAMRQFDIASKDSDRFSGVLQLTPVSQFAITASAGVGKEDYPDTATGFGLRNNDNHDYSIGVDFVPNDIVSLGVSYQYAKFTALQWSRTANPLPAGASLSDPKQQFNDPRRDWSDNSADKTNDVNASMDLIKLIPKTDIRVAYDWNKDESTYVYGLAANTTLPALVQLSPVTNKLQRGTLDITHHVTPHVALGMVYWYDKYAVNDYAFSPNTINSVALPSFLTLGYLYRPYTAQTVTARVSYFW